MRMGQGVRTGFGHGGITCVLQTQFSSFSRIQGFHWDFQNRSLRDSLLRKGGVSLEFC